jgi:tetratricopeptide (TPR) repeat protein
MSDGPDPLWEFQRRMGTATQVAPGASAELLLEVMDKVPAKLLRLCAIPHQFDADIVHTMAPTLERAEIQQRCEVFARLSFVSTDAEGWTLHDGVRQHFFSQWLMPQSAEEFAGASRRLAAFFKERAGRLQGEPAETARRRSMFHLLGADHESGFREFELLLRRARHDRSYSECSQLIRLVHEYDTLLPSRYHLWLAYHEAKLSADLRDLDEAEAGYQRVLDDPATPPELRSLAYVRLGYVHKERRNWDESIRCYEQGLALAEKTEGARQTLPRILADLGAAFQERGDLELAEALLNRSVELAQEQRNPTSLALAYDGLGRLALDRREADVAIDAFEKSLDALPREELVRTAQAYNNLGLAYSYLPDWTRSEEYFQKSLDIKYKAGDTLGQAFALDGLARVQASRGDLKAAIDNSARAIALFSEMRDRYRAAHVKHNRGKLLRRMNDRESARNDFTEAMEEFRALGNAIEADAAAHDLQALADKNRLPWWAWAAIVLFTLWVLLLIVALSTH